MRGMHESQEPWWRRPRPAAPGVIAAPVLLGAGFCIGGITEIVDWDTPLSVIGGLGMTVVGALAPGAALAYLARPTRR